MEAKDSGGSNSISRRGKSALSSILSVVHRPSASETTNFGSAMRSPPSPPMSLQFHYQRSPYMNSAQANQECRSSIEIPPTLASQHVTSNTRTGTSNALNSSGGRLSVSPQSIRHGHHPLEQYVPPTGPESRRFVSDYNSHPQNHALPDASRQKYVESGRSTSTTFSSNRVASYSESPSHGGRHDVHWYGQGGQEYYNGSCVDTEGAQSYQIGGGEDVRHGEFSPNITWAGHGNRF